MDSSRASSAASTILFDSDLPSPDITFDSAAAVFDRLYHPGFTDDALVVGHVSPDDFQALEAERDARGRKCRFFFLREAEMVIVTIPTGPHEQLHISFTINLNRAMSRMGVENEWEWMAAEMYSASSGSAGEGDASGGPASVRTVIDWPTLVIESGYTQTIQSLRAKARWWFAASGHRIKVVLLVKMHLSQSSVQVEKWTEPAPTGRPGATTTRRSVQTGQAAWQPVRRQVLEVLWTGATPIRAVPREDRANPALYRVNGGPLTLGFAELFLRAPVGGEHDFVLTDLELQHIAARAWKRL
ncbi:hypothetical protein SCUCBS95973_008400 [Sporothrix curviconia]|uniref:Dead deah box DNA helicase n=1 Tax=Sporothrix curviconia TaxID=1260050 RepID=A0ABP0CNU8_9PEZI